MASLVCIHHAVEQVSEPCGWIGHTFYFHAGPNLVCIRAPGGFLNVIHRNIDSGHRGRFCACAKYLFYRNGHTVMIFDADGVLPFALDGLVCRGLAGVGDNVLLLAYDRYSIHRFTIAGRDGYTMERVEAAQGFYISGIHQGSGEVYLRRWPNGGNVVYKSTVDRIRDGLPPEPCQVIPVNDGPCMASADRRFFARIDDHVIYVTSQRDDRRARVLALA